MDLRNVLLEIHGDLRDARIEHALIGGLALAAHGAARATVDIDWLVEAERADDVDRIALARSYTCLHRSAHAANYAAEQPARGRIDFLFARQAYGRAMLARASARQILGHAIRVVDASDLIGLKVQASSNDPRRRHLDLADIARLIEAGEVDLGRVREYFRIFDREKELDALLAERGR